MDANNISISRLVLVVKTVKQMYEIKTGEVYQPGSIAWALAFLALCKVGFVSSFVCLAMC